MLVGLTVSGVIPIIPALDIKLVLAVAVYLLTGSPKARLNALPDES